MLVWQAPLNRNYCKRGFWLAQMPLHNTARGASGENRLTSYSSLAMAVVGNYARNEIKRGPAKYDDVLMLCAG